MAAMIMRFYLLEIGRVCNTKAGLQLSTQTDAQRNDLLQGRVICIDTPVHKRDQPIDRQMRATA
jgi:hypothetical protein